MSRPDDSPDVATLAVLNTAQAAELLQVDRHTIGRLVRSGSLRAKRIGNRYVFRREWIDAFLEDDGFGVTAPLSGKKRLELMRYRETN